MASTYEELFEGNDFAWFLFNEIRQELWPYRYNLDFAKSLSEAHVYNLSYKFQIIDKIVVKVSAHSDLIQFFAKKIAMQALDKIKEIDLKELDLIPKCAIEDAAKYMAYNTALLEGPASIKWIDPPAFTKVEYEYLGFDEYAYSNEYEDSNPNRKNLFDELIQKLEEKKK